MVNVVLVNEKDEQLGIMEKMDAHRKALLHRAFSVFVFNDEGDMLLQRRAENKYHSGGLWTNACCSHPFPGEDVLTGAQRRLNEELGFTTGLKKIFDFIYKSGFDNGLTEFEFDHVFVGVYNGLVFPNENEVSDYCFMGMEEIEASLKNHPEKFSAWFHIAWPRIKEWHSKNSLQKATS
ncbi:MAG: isopentenyl-diphosphate Delta-isomerase [Bacteroidetes bacterium]|nr:isopentenyl-diphosphate Delta-isomerase [Bacteroidota bacterium]